MGATEVKYIISIFSWLVVSDSLHATFLLNILKLTERMPRVAQPFLPHLKTLQSPIYAIWALLHIDLYLIGDVAVRRLK